MAAAKWPSPGLRNVGSYQISGHPFITGSSNLDDGKVHLVQFPFVCKSFTVVNTNTTSGYNIRVHFQSGSGVTAVTVAGETGAQTIASSADVIAGFHYVTVPAGNSSLTMDARCEKIYVSNGSGNDNLSYQVFAELTTVDTGSMYHLTGSGITEL